MSDSIRYCLDNKGLELNGYVFMLNHIHLIVTSPDVAGFLRDFKRFTSAKFRANLEATGPSVLKLFMDAQGSYRFGWKLMPRRRSKTLLSIFKNLIIFTKTRYEKVMFLALNIGFGHRPTRLLRSLPNCLRHIVPRLTADSRTGAVAPFETFSFGYV
jgi:REP element-mobilizing transposase RayT